MVGDSQCEDKTDRQTDRQRRRETETGTDRDREKEMSIHACVQGVLAQLIECKN